jgi:transcriptional regulator with XRE-family HTH domain
VYWERWTTSYLDVIAAHDVECEAQDLVRSICSTAGLTRQQLGDILGVSRKTVTNWLGGDPPDRKHLNFLVELGQFVDRLDRKEPGLAAGVLEPAYGDSRRQAILRALRTHGAQAAFALLLAPRPSEPSVEAPTALRDLSADQWADLIAALPPAPASQLELAPDEADASHLGSSDAPYTRRSGPRNRNTPLSSMPG